MGFLSWVVLGLLVGVLAKWIMPGPDPGGLVFTILLGIAGALLGGFLGARLGLGTATGFNLGTLVLAVAGSMLLLGAWRRLRGGARG